MTVRTGIEVLNDDGFAALSGKRVGLLVNPSAVDRSLRSTVDILREQVQLAALFSPEHGFAASADQESIESHVDPRTGIPVHSLYRNWQSIKPTPAMLADIDVLVCDLQDIGARFYTYAWAVSQVLEGAGAAGVPVMVLDRPNPLGGRIDGPLLDMQLVSAVGRAPIPIQHGLTLGELMRLFNTQWNPTPASLSVIECRGYHHGLRWEDTGLPFVPTSPAMAHLDTVYQYPGACLVEGTNLSEGRGTALPFEIVGAPFIDPYALIAELEKLGLRGVAFRPHSFQPSSSKFAGEVCQGIQVHRQNDDFRPLAVWISVISAIRQLYPNHFEWNGTFFDKLAGNSILRQQIDAGESADQIVDSWGDAFVAFDKLRRDALLYP